MTKFTIKETAFRTSFREEFETSEECLRGINDWIKAAKAADPSIVKFLKVTGANRHTSDLDVLDGNGKFIMGFAPIRIEASND